MAVAITYFMGEDPCRCDQDHLDDLWGEDHRQGFMTHFGHEGAPCGNT